jgi:hypothetical protein
VQGFPSWGLSRRADQGRQCAGHWPCYGSLRWRRPSGSWAAAAATAQRELGRYGGGCCCGPSDCRSFGSGGNRGMSARPWTASAAAQSAEGKRDSRTIAGKGPWPERVNVLPQGSYSTIQGPFHRLLAGCKRLANKTLRQRGVCHGCSGVVSHNCCIRSMS